MIFLLTVKATEPLGKGVFEDFHKKIHDLVGSESDIFTSPASWGWEFTERSAAKRMRNKLINHGYSASVRRKR